MENEKNKEYENEPKGSPIREFPNFVTLLDDGNYKIEMRKLEGIKNKYDYFVLEDMTHNKLKTLIDRCKNSKGEVMPDKLDELMIQNAILYPNLTSNDIDNMKSSEVFRLKKAINLIYDIENFL